MEQVQKITACWPQIAFIVISLFFFGKTAFKNGQEYRTKFTFYDTAVLAIQIVLLAIGEFQVVSWAGLTFCLVMVIGMATHLKDLGQTDTYNLTRHVFAAIINHLILYWGGFYHCFE